MHGRLITSLTEAVVEIVDAAAVRLFSVRRDDDGRGVTVAPAQWASLNAESRISGQV